MQFDKGGASATSGEGSRAGEESDDEQEEDSIRFELMESKTATMEPKTSKKITHERVRKDSERGIAMLPPCIVGRLLLSAQKQHWPRPATTRPPRRGLGARARAARGPARQLQVGLPQSLAAGMLF